MVLWPHGCWLQVCFEHHSNDFGKRVTKTGNLDEFWSHLHKQFNGVNDDNDLKKFESISRCVGRVVGSVVPGREGIWLLWVQLANQHIKWKTQHNGARSTDNTFILAPVSISTRNWNGCAVANRLWSEAAPVFVAHCSTLIVRYSVTCI